VGVDSPGKSKKSNFVPQRKGRKTSKRSELNANANFLAKNKQQRDLLKKWLLDWT
jgi:hypothetical protein